MSGLTKNMYGGRSSVGRAPGCDPGCRGFESHRSPHIFLLVFAKVAELVDALDLGSSGATCESSSLSFRTIFIVSNESILIYFPRLAAGTEQ